MILFILECFIYYLLLFIYNIYTAFPQPFFIAKEGQKEKSNKIFTIKKRKQKKKKKYKSTSCSDEKQRENKFGIKK